MKLEALLLFSRTTAFGPYPELGECKGDKMTVFFVVASCNLVEAFRRFRGAFFLRYYRQLMEAASNSETPASFYQTTPRNNLEDSHLQ
jgi:hypothetical protein